MRRILEGVKGELTMEAAPWAVDRDAFADATAAAAPRRFSEAFERWRQLYQSAREQLIEAGRYGPCGANAPGWDQGIAGENPHAEPAHLARDQMRGAVAAVRVAAAGDKAAEGFDVRLLLQHPERADDAVGGGELGFAVDA